jgi:chromosome segregation ATPase
MKKRGTRSKIMGKKTDAKLEEIKSDVASIKHVLSNLTSNIGVLIQKEDALRARVEESNTLYNEFRAKYNDILDDIRSNLSQLVRSGPNAVERRLIDVADNIDSVLRDHRAGSRDQRFCGPSTAELAVELELRQLGA